MAVEQFVAVVASTVVADAANLFLLQPQRADGNFVSPFMFLVMSHIKQAQPWKLPLLQ